MKFSVHKPLRNKTFLNLCLNVVNMPKGAARALFCLKTETLNAAGKQAPLPRMTGVNIA
ncbi:hypothetical protein Dalk_2489 [Desulfatibacillum aliphaticivorans]|uniref:Uncharacterized protein n=1 Tax=Desulfatibacillum aliphaticivorans TaxID=218208 RepID=B8FFC2_DESAL|nr:hypothetical protein Dalk_2489 [Desulfatibacillum aliphaticivorans]